jgi:hypothetical protein
MQYQCWFQSSAIYPFVSLIYAGLLIDSNPDFRWLVIENRSDEIRIGELSWYITYNVSEAVDGTLGRHATVLHACSIPATKSHSVFGSMLDESELTI